MELPSFFLSFFSLTHSLPLFGSHSLSLSTKCSSITDWSDSRKRDSYCVYSWLYVFCSCCSSRYKRKNEKKYHAITSQEGDDVLYLERTSFRIEEKKSSDSERERERNLSYSKKGYYNDNWLRNHFLSLSVGADQGRWGERKREGEETSFSLFSYPPLFPPLSPLYSSCRFIFFFDSSSLVRLKSTFQLFN